MSRFDDPDDRDYDDHYYDDRSGIDEEAAYEEIVRESLRNIPIEAAKTYLGKFGDAIDARVTACLAQAEELLAAHFPSVSLTLSLTAVEIMIRFLLLRPLMQGAFLSEEWAEVLLRRIGTGRTAEDRELLPAVLGNWDIDIDQFRTTAGETSLAVSEGDGVAGARPVRACLRLGSRRPGCRGTRQCAGVPKGRDWTHRRPLGLYAGAYPAVVSDQDDLGE